MKRIAMVLGALMLALTSFGTASATDPTPTPTPGPAILSIQKTPFSSTATRGDLVQFSVTVYNTGQSDATGVIIVDRLPVDGPVTDWFITASSWSGGCAITAGVLQCQGTVQRRHLNDSSTDFVTGSSTVTYLGVARSCGVIPNDVLMIWGDVTRAAYASVTVRGCETPTPVPTPTSAPSPTSTPSPTVVPATVTPTPARVIPLPPRTGTGLMPPESGYATPTLAAIALLVGISAALYIAARKV